MTGETKGELEARRDELSTFLTALRGILRGPLPETLEAVAAARLRELSELRAGAPEDLFQSVLRSHKAVCAAKAMDEKAAYGQDPALYYTLAICGEAGELGNKLVKALRNGNNPEAARRAVISELPDIFVYGAVLARVLDLDLTKLVNEKVEIVIERAKSGYYGGPLTSQDAMQSSRAGLPLPHASDFGDGKEPMLVDTSNGPAKTRCSRARRNRLVAFALTALVAAGLAMAGWWFLSAREQLIRCVSKDERLPNNLSP